MIAFAYGKVSNLEWKPSSKKEKEAAIVERGHLVSEFPSDTVEALKKEVERLIQEKSASEHEVHQRERTVREALLQKGEANVVEAHQKEVEAKDVHLKESAGRGAST
ncbi:hypothetical protein Ancab_038150 [Ancistrocladus abbreviatus]